jgi:uncharacterized protein
MRSAVLALAAVLGAGCVAVPGAPRPPARLPAPALPPAPAASVQAPPQAVTPEQVASGFADLLAAHDFRSAADRFDRAMRASLPPEVLDRAWQSIESNAGAPKGNEVIEVIPRPPRTHVWLAIQFERAGWNIEVVVDAARRVSGLRVMPAPQPWAPPDYAAAATITERPVNIGSPALPGIWATSSPAPTRAAVLVHGTGPQDADASVGPRGQGNKLFKDLAWGLAAQGIAVLRYPKRTWSHPEEFEGKAFTLDDEVTLDACAAVEEAGRQLGTGPSHVVLIGHSLGAAMAPRIARACPSLAGLVMLAAPSRALDQVLFDQFLYLLSLAGKNRNETAAEVSELLSGFSLALGPLGPPGEELSFSGMRAPRSYWADVTRYDPSRAMAEVRARLLLVQGGRDYQVTTAEFEAWKKVLRGRSHVTFKLYPALDHRLVAGRGAPGPVDYQRPGHVAREVIDDVLRWILEPRP